VNAPIRPDALVSYGEAQLHEETFRAFLDAQAPAPKVSAEPPVPSGRKLLPAFRSARELAAELPEDVPWIVPGYLARGSMTEVDGRAKAAGKSTWLTHLVAAVLDGAPFLGRPTEQTGVVYLTEQPPTSLRALLGRTGLTDRDDLRLLLWRDCRGTPWPELVEVAVAECRSVGAGILIVDTLGAFSGVRGDSENDAGAALEAMTPLLAAAADGLAKLLGQLAQQVFAGEIAACAGDLVLQYIRE